MIDRDRVSSVTGCLMLLWTAVSAQQQTAPDPVPAMPAPAQPAPVPLRTIPPTPAQPVPFNAGPVRPAAATAATVKPGAAPPPPTPAPTAVAPTAPVLGYPLNPAAPAPPPLGSELRGKLKVDEQHFGEKSAAAKREFELRQAEEYKEFEATLADKGFWERRRLTRAFQAAQAKRRREFNDEQETKRRTYEWRFP